MNLIKYFLNLGGINNEKENEFSIRNNFADMLRDTINLDDQLFRKFWKEFFPKVTLSSKQIEYISNYYGYARMKKVIWSMNELHLDFKLTDEQKWYYGVYYVDEDD